MAKTKRLNPDNKKTKYKASPMSRTSGVAKRKSANVMSESERIGRQRQAAAAETGPRDRFNPAAAQAVVDTLGFGVNSSGKFEFNPIATLGMALPVGKVLNAARALQAAGKASQAAPLFARAAAKIGGRIGKKASAVGNAGRGPFSPKNLAKEEAAIKRLTGRALSSTGARAASESAFPRLPGASNLPPRSARTFDIYADPFEEGASRFQGGVVRKTSGAYGEAAMPRVASRLPKPKLPKGRGR
jgi:hypothetical protein